jgi:hypothetical protein
MIWYYLSETLTAHELSLCSKELIYNKYSSSPQMDALIESSAIMKMSNFQFNHN